MATETEKLVLLFEAQNRDVLRKLRQIERQSQKSFAASSKSAGKLSAGLNAVHVQAAGLLRSFGGGALVGGLGLTALVAGARDAARQVATIGDEAERAGVSVEALQELRFVADQNRIGVVALVDGLKELNLRADEFVVTGKGPAAEAFQRLGFEAGELSRRLDDPSALLVEIVRRMENLDTAAQIRVADELFGGTAGERFVELLDEGADEIERMQSQARDLGLVLDEEMIAKAVEVDRKFNILATTIETRVKTAFVEASDAALDFWTKARPVFEAMGRDRLTQYKLSDLYDENGNPVQPNNHTTGGSFGEAGKGGAAGDRGTSTDTGSSGGRSKATSDAERQAEAIARVVEQLELEAAAIGHTASQQRLMNELASLNVGVTSEQGQKIAGLIDEIESLEQQQERAAASAAFLQDSMSQAFSDIAGQIDTGNAALDNFLAKLIEVGAQSLFGQGPLASLLGGGSSGGGGFLGGLFGGFRAAGGPVAAGRSYVVGEKGPELFVPRGAGSIFPNGASAGGGVSINVQVSGASGDDHIRTLVRQGVGAAIGQYDSGSFARHVKDGAEARKSGVFR